MIDGNYDTYLHFVKQGLAREARAGVAAEAASGKAWSGAPRIDEAPSQTAKERRKRKFPYRKTATSKRDRRARIQNRSIARAVWLSEEVLRDGAKIKELKAELAEHEAALPQLYEHWEEATELNS